MNYLPIPLSILGPIDGLPGAVPGDVLVVDLNLAEPFILQRDSRPICAFPASIFPAIARAFARGRVGSLGSGHENTAFETLCWTHAKVAAMASARNARAPAPPPRPCKPRVPYLRLLIDHGRHT